MNGRFPKRSASRTAARPVAERGIPVARMPAQEWLGNDRLFTPLGYEAGYDYPLVVWLPDPANDSFSLGRTMKRLSLRNFIALEPVADVDAAGLDGREDAVWRAIDRVCDRLSINTARIFLVGEGEGGADAFRIACRHPDAFAGAVSLGGAFPLAESLFARLSDVRRMPMLLCCHGSDSPAAAHHTDQTLRLFHAAGASLAMRIYPGTARLSKAILCDVNRWLMDEICGASVPMRSACAR
jgi:phospholipase/carboxylesterase